VIRDPGSHRRRDPQRSVDAAEVVVREMQGQGRLQVLPLFRERVGQPGEPLAPLAKRSVVPLYVRSSRSVQIRPAAHDVFLNAYEPCGTVTLGYAIQAVREQLHHLAVIRAVVEARVDGRLVRLEGVRTHVEPTRSRGPADLGNEILRVDPIPLSEVPSHHEF